ncbi:hypothetical protein [Virgibacillus phasianinus]|nr:hypothetical protein [Virgibacillus phasianinus]
MNQELSIEDFNEMLQKWTGKRIKIFKHEIEDNDETLMNLDNVSYAEQDATIDDYVAKHILQLNGTGVIENDDHEHEPLPSPTYEIPLEDSTNYQFDGSRFNLKNDRGHYSIELCE